LKNLIRKDYDIASIYL